MFCFRILFLLVLVKNIANNLSEKFLVDMKLFEMDLLDKCEDIANLKHQYYTLHKNRAKMKYFDRKFNQFQQANIEMNQLIATSATEIHENYEHQSANKSYENHLMKTLMKFRISNDEVFRQRRCQQFFEKKYYDFRTRGELERILANQYVRRRQTVADLKSALNNYNRNFRNEIDTISCQPDDLFDLFETIDNMDNSSSKFEVDFLSFENLNSTWNEIAFLYEDLLEFVKLRISQKYRISFTNDDQPIPSFLLGSILGDDWTNLFEFVLPYPEFVKRNLFDKIENNQTIDNLLKEIALNSSLEIDIIDNYDICPIDLLYYCRTATTKLTICNRLRMSDYFDLFEKYIENVLLKKDRNYGLAAAIATANDRKKIPIFNEIVSIMNCFNVLDTIFVRNSSDLFELKMMRKLLLALRFLPKLAYYQFVEKWRMEIFAKNQTSDWTNILSLWSKMRLQEQNVEDSSLTFLFDPNIILNKPYIGKFFATIMQFQLLDEIGKIEDNETGDFQFPTNQFPSFIKKVLENNDNDVDDDNNDNYHKNYLIRELLVSKIVRYFRPVFAYLRNVNNSLPEFQEEKQPQQPIITTMDSSMKTNAETAETVTNSLNTTVSILASVIANNSRDDYNGEQEQSNTIDVLLELKVAACAFIITFVACFILMFLLIFLYRRCRSCCKKTKFPKNRRYS